MNNFKKNLATNITLIMVLVFTAIHLLVVTLNLFGAVSLNFPIGFNYLLAYTFIVLSLALYILSFFLTKLKNLKVPEWICVLFYVAFFLFTNVYYICGWFESIIALIFLYIYLAFLANIVSLSIFYNIQKDEKNRLKSSKNYIVTSVFMFSVAVCSILLLFITAIKAFAFPTYELTTVITFVIEMCTMLLTSMIMAITFSISLSKTKTFINCCLIKYNIPQDVQKSVRDKQL